jgi:hypothetical protein
MQAHPNGLSGFVSNRTKVDILLLSITLNEFYADIYQLVNTVGERYLKYFARTQESLVMFAQAE